MRLKMHLLCRCRDQLFGCETEVAISLLTIGQGSLPHCRRCLFASVCDFLPLFSKPTNWVICVSYFVSFLSSSIVSNFWSFTSRGRCDYTRTTWIIQSNLPVLKFVGLIPCEKLFCHVTRKEKFASSCVTPLWFTLNTSSCGSQRQNEM